MELLSIILAVISGLGTALAYIDYNRSAQKRTTEPNGATWAIFATISLLSTSSYLAASGDIWKSIVALVNVGFCIMTFVLTLATGKFKRLDALEWCTLSVGIIAAIAWKFETAAYANAIVQIAIFLGFIPTWRGIWGKGSLEHPRPWWIWCASYAIAALVVILRWRHQWVDLLYPVLCILLHASVPLVGTVSRMVKSTRATI